MKTPVSDLIVIFGGWGQKTGGQPLPHRCIRDEHKNHGGFLPGGPAFPGHADSDTSELVQKVEEITTTAPVLYPTRIVAIQGTVGNVAVHEAYNFVRAHFHPFGRLVIYGYSIGGFNALSLCHKIQSEMPAFDLRSWRPTQGLAVEGGVAGMLPQRLCGPRPPTHGAVRVDLVITVDAALGPLSGVAPRHVAPCVRRNLNFYQTTPQARIRSCGGPNIALDPQRTNVENNDHSLVANHASLDKYTQSVSLEAIEEALTRKARFVPHMPALPQ
jgi:hypothetical protein